MGSLELIEFESKHKYGSRTLNLIGIFLSHTNALTYTPKIKTELCKLNSIKHYVINKSMDYVSQEMLSIYSLQQSRRKGLSTYEIQGWWAVRERKWEERERERTTFEWFSLSTM